MPPSAPAWLTYLPSRRAQGTDEFNQALHEFGCRIDGELIRFPDSVVDTVLARIEVAKVARSDHLKPQFSVGATRRVAPTATPASIDHTYRDKIHYAASGQALYCSDVETDTLRAATTQDLSGTAPLRSPSTCGWALIPRTAPTACC